MRALVTALLLAPVPLAAQVIDDTPRIAVMSAFAPEWNVLQQGIEKAETHTINGNDFIAGTLEGKDVLLVLSGVSMVNAAMNTQIALDRFTVDRIVFSGIAGGVDPAYDIGDVIVPARWGEYLDAIMARETADGFEIPPWMSSAYPNLGMRFVRNQTVLREGLSEPESRFWFPVDPDMLGTAQEVAARVVLPDCAEDGSCLEATPEIVVGGNGVSGAAFVDNAELRTWALEAFEARVLDMESAAVAHVAYANDVPFIAFRSLSDLAGGGEGANEMETFMDLAATNSATVMRAFLAALD
ncbi:adenosylhomocysteine nucleosidase [Palleronia aestuarii]|uniref:Adenosylhomocysteine nucleosidase n=1 Tax=Palleronia aestuarii TaxID=568105 RepID=A0A2W7NBG6_9RHOB|nr:5'-methylthioadenosine/S-adenosylhomocysteine nucleosidase [Palleronia aestuarii]PZX17681.1 adenosylhomocysteine nucleosidase [Palleronia aestuarii]